MARGIQVILGLGLAGLLLVPVSDPPGEPRQGMVGGRAGSRLAHPTPVAPNAEAEDEAGRQAPPAIVPQPGVELKNSGETLSVTVRQGTGQSPRLPVDPFLRTESHHG